MKHDVVLCAAVFMFAAGAATAAEQYDCVSVYSDSKGGYHASRDETVELTIDGQTVGSRVRIAAASKDLAFAGCSPVRIDGSNFSRWFAVECRTLGSVDGSSFTVEPFLADAYAGISPKIDVGYDMYLNLRQAATEAGVTTPERTFVIYADRKPRYEFFCYGKP